MSRFFIPTKNTRSFYVDDEVFVRPMDNIPSVCDHDSTPTGLLDINGNEIHKAPRAIGFGRRNEW